MDTSAPQGTPALQGTRAGSGMYWSAAESARRCRVSRATIDRAIKSGKLAAEKDAEGSWRISPHALTEAGLNPSKPPPPEDAATGDQAVEGMVSAEVHRLTVEAVEARAEARVQAAQSEARVQAARADEMEKAANAYWRLQLEAAPAPAPVAPETPPQSAPMHTPQPDPVGPPRGNRGKPWGRLRAHWSR